MNCIPRARIASTALFAPVLSYPVAAQQWPARSVRIGNLLMSGVILGRDPATGAMPERIEDQCANMFVRMKAIVEAGGGTTDDIIKMTVWLQDRTQRAPVNVERLKMFPDEHSRPARHALQMNMDGGALAQCDFTAVID